VRKRHVPDSDVASGRYPGEVDDDRSNGSRADRKVDPHRDAATRSYGMLAGLAPGRSLSDELIAERRQEASREDAAERAAHAA